MCAPIYDAGWLVGYAVEDAVVLFVLVLIVARADTSCAGACGAVGAVAGEVLEGQICSHSCQALRVMAIVLLGMSILQLNFSPS